MIKTKSAVSNLTIEFLVNCWNQSKNEKQKLQIKELLTSSDTRSLHKGLGLLAELGQTEFDMSGCAGFTDFEVMTKSVILLRKEFWRHERDPEKIINVILDCRNEAGFYFTQMFQAGHFEQLPMPDFGYELPPANLASFQKFCQEQEHKLDTTVGTHQICSSQADDGL
ncbi:MAG: hypothetical protein KGJ35_01995 [Patescibacteria group bacterium]|nr:hypothetical protein [Patescibacteria group bacterium]